MGSAEHVEGAPDPLIGTELGDYLIEGLLGVGGMGAVYRARDLALGRPVALKVMLGHLLGDASARARFQREITNAARIEHPHVVPLYAAGYEQGHFFIAMRLIDGPDLAGVLEGGALATSRAVARFGEMAAALQSIHRDGYVHRDVKPQNILIAHRDHPGEYAVLGDLGISRALDSSTVLTQGVVGSPEYMAPEVLRWQPAVPASDQYALACVLFEMLTGRSPYGDLDVPSAHLDAPIPRLGDALSGVSDSVDLAIRRALAKEPADRFDDVREFAEAVSREFEAGPGAAPAGPGTEAPRSRTDKAPGTGDPLASIASETTLDAEIAIVLDLNGNTWMTARDIAREVNRRGRVRGRKGSHITGSHVLSLVDGDERFDRNGVSTKLLPS